MNAPFSRRDFLKLMSAVVAGSMLAACAPKPTPTAPAPTEAPKAVEPTAAPPEKKVLKGKLAWYAAQAADHLPPFQEQHKMWDAMYPDVQIEEVFSLGRIHHQDGYHDRWRRIH